MAFWDKSACLIKELAMYPSDSSSTDFFLAITEGFYLPSFAANLNQQAIIYGVGGDQTLQM